MSTSVMCSAPLARNDRPRLSGWQRKRLKLQKQEREIEAMQRVIDLCFERLGKDAMREILEEARNV